MEARHELFEVTVRKLVRVDSGARASWIETSPVADGRLSRLALAPVTRELVQNPAPGSSDVDEAGDNRPLPACDRLFRDCLATYLDELANGARTGSTRDRRGPGSHVAPLAMDPALIT